MVRHYRALPPARPRLAALKFADVLASVPDLPPLPDQVNWADGITDWGMDGNDDAGDCVECAGAHADMLWSANATGTPLAITGQQVIGRYSQTTGYNPATGANDNGTDIATFLQSWQTTGYWGTQIAGFAEVDASNTDHFKRAINDLGCLVLGVRLPKSAENQFDAGQVWTPNPWGFIVGGHCVLAVSYGADGFQIVTWGKLQPVEWGFIGPHVNQAYACVSPLFLNRAGQTPGGLTLDVMRQRLAAVAA